MINNTDNYLNSQIHSMNELSKLLLFIQQNKAKVTTYQIKDIHKLFLKNTEMIYSNRCFIYLDKYDKNYTSELVSKISELSKICKLIKLAILSYDPLVYIKTYCPLSINQDNKIIIFNNIRSHKEFKKIKRSTATNIINKIMSIMRDHIRIGEVSVENQSEQALVNCYIEVFIIKKIITENYNQIYGNIINFPYIAL